MRREARGRGRGTEPSRRRPIAADQGRAGRRGGVWGANRVGAGRARERGGGWASNWECGPCGEGQGVAGLGRAGLGEGVRDRVPD